MSPLLVVAGLLGAVQPPPSTTALLDRLARQQRALRSYSIEFQATRVMQIVPAGAADATSRSTGVRLARSGESPRPFVSTFRDHLVLGSGRRIERLDEAGDVSSLSVFAADDDTPPHKILRRLGAGTDYATYWKPVVAGRELIDFLRGAGDLLQRRREGSRIVLEVLPEGLTESHRDGVRVHIDPEQGFNPVRIEGFHFNEGGRALPSSLTTIAYTLLPNGLHVPVAGRYQRHFDAGALAGKPMYECRFEVNRSRSRWNGPIPDKKFDVGKMAVGKDSRRLPPTRRGWHEVVINDDPAAPRGVPRWFIVAHLPVAALLFFLLWRRRRRERTDA